MAAQRKYSPRPILGKGEDLATALHQEVQAISNAITGIQADIKSGEKKFRDETEKALAEITERFFTSITDIDGRITSIAEWSIEMTNEIKGVARVDALVALNSRLEVFGEEVSSYVQYIVDLNNTVNGKADAHVVLRLENLITVLGDTVTAYGAIIQEIEVSLNDKASVAALQALEATVIQNGNDILAIGSAITALRADVIGSGVPNKLANSEFQELLPWVFGQAGGTSGYEYGVANDIWPTYSLAGTINKTLFITKPSAWYTSAANYAHFSQDLIPVESEKTYQFSVYLQAHRCIGQIWVNWLKADKTSLSSVQGNPITTIPTPRAGGLTLDEFPRSYVIAVAPADAKYAKVFIRLVPNGDTLSLPPHLFVTCPLFGTALEGQTTPSPYSEGGSAGTALGMKALTVRVEQNEGDISAITTDITDLSVKVNNPKPGQNMLVDPLFQTKNAGAWTTVTNAGWGIGINLPSWTLASDSGEVTPYTFFSGTYTASATGYSDFIQENIPAEAGKRYQFSSYLGVHRCEGVLFLHFLNSSGTLLSGATSSLVTKPTTVSGGTILDLYDRVGGFATAPAGTASIRLYIRARWMGPSPSTVTNPYMFVARPFVGTATAEQTELSDWAPGSPGNMFAHLRQEGMVWADSTGEGTVGASYELKLRAFDNTGEASAGFGLTASKVNGVWRSQMDIGAERFRVIDTATGSVTVPFEIVGGVTYIKSAAIRDASIANAKIASLSASKLTAGALQVGTSITSTSYVAGSAGWAIFAGGNAEFDTIMLRGKITGPQVSDQIINTNHLASQAAMYMVPFQVIGAGFADANFYAGAGGLDVTRAYVCIVQVYIPYAGSVPANTTYAFAVKVAIDNNAQAEVVFNRTFSVQSTSSGQLLGQSMVFYGFLDPSGYAAFAKSGSRYVRVTLTAARPDAYAIGTLICQKN
jgi:hypothetical protein